MNLRLYDVSYNTIFDRGPLLEALDLYRTHRILVPLSHHATVEGLALMLGLKTNFVYVKWHYGSGMLDGWLVVVDPDTDTFSARGHQLVQLEPRK